MQVCPAENMADDSDSYDALKHELKETAFICQLVGIGCYAVVTLTVYTLFINIVARRTFTELPIKVKISLLVYLVYAPGTLAIMILLLRHDRSWGLNIYFVSHWQRLTTMCVTIWMSLHWQFTAYYL